MKGDSYEKNIAKLVIPSRLDGKPVYKLCSGNEDLVGADNLFGLDLNDENNKLGPQK